MKRLMVLLCVLLLVCGITGTATGTPVYLNGVTSSSGWADADGTGDVNMCWAAAASNALFFTGWNGGFTTADQILNYYKSHWTDGTGNAFYGTEWFFDGVETSVSGGGSTVNTSDGGNFYSFAYWDANVGALIPPPTFSGIKTWVDRSNTQDDVGSYGIIGRENIGVGHYINIWGYDTDGTSIYITDNNTAFRGLEMKLFDDLHLNLSERINENLAGVLPNQTVPEPTSTLLLLGIGLFGLSVGYRKRR